MQILLEVCCGCLEDAVNAESGGADRIELNTALFLGGLTPSEGLLREVKNRVQIPVICMVRPREGGFCYTAADYAVMKAGAEALLKSGADGLAFGFLKEDGAVDELRTAEFIDFVRKLNPDAQLVFHRAFDVVPNREAALETLISLGVHRVLTSGGRESAPKGAENIRKLIRQAAGRIEILPGGGITPENAAEFVKATGTAAIHASARKVVCDPSTRQNPEIFFGGKIGGAGVPEDEYKVTDADRVRALKAAAQSGREEIE